MSNTILLCTIDHLAFGVEAEAVEEVVRAVAWSPSPRDSGAAIGVINRRGDMIPLVNTWLFFELNQRPIVPSDTYVVLNSHAGRLAIVASRIDKMLSTDQAIAGRQVGFADGQSLQLVSSDAFAQFAKDLLEQLAHYHQLHG